MRQFLILFLFINFVVIVQAQDIPKKANTIIVHGVTLSEVVNQLLDAGYFIDKADTVFNLITTKERACKKNKGTFVTYMIRIKDSSAIFKGNCSDHIGFTLDMVQFAAQDYEIVYKGGLFKIAFNDMNNLALSFNKPVEYSIQ
jgi:hypothetical protein